MSTNSVVDIESSEVTHTVSSSARETSDLDHSISEGLSYKWVNPRVLKIPTSFRNFDVLDKFFSKVSFIKPDAPSDALMDGICGYSDRVCHGRENAPHDFFFVYDAFFHDLHVTLPFDDFTMGFFESSMWRRPNCTPIYGRAFRRLG